MNLIDLVLEIDKKTISGPKRVELSKESYNECVDLGTVDEFWRSAAVKLAKRTMELDIWNLGWDL